MNIRKRMERELVGVVSASVIGAAALVHVAWALGSTWPRATSDALADLVVGQRPFPSSPATWTVAGLLAVAATAVAADAAPRERIPVVLRRPCRVASKLTSAALIARGLGGLVVSGIGILDSTEEFRRMDIRLYSPVCLGLGVGAAFVAWSRR